MSYGKDENALVARIGRRFRPATARPLALRFGDDAALFRPQPNFETILTCDWFLEGSHFLRGKHPAEAVGWKSLARAVSDIAAMGGRPQCFLLSLALPRSLTGKWLDDYLCGLRRASRALRCELAGGDTTRHDKVLISIAVIGEVRRGQAVQRRGARPGDLVFVSGTLGEAELGLRKLQRHHGSAKGTDATLRKHLYPHPRLALGEWLAGEELATSMMDLSDGLSTDLPRLCSESGVGARIDTDSLPVCDSLSSEEARTLALHGGDDYELLFTVKPENLRRLSRRFGGVKLTRIGEITREKKILLLEKGKTLPLKPQGWDPFRRSGPAR